MLKDDDGQEHLLIIQAHSPLSTKSRWGFAYYLFAVDGKWEDGGLFEASSIYTQLNVIFQPEKNRAMIEINFKPIQLTDSTGKVTTIESSFHLGDTLHDLLEIKGGKLVPSIETNVYPLPSPLDETFGVTPLRHFGD